MILKSLKLENIRSYKQHEVHFLPGTTLFEGDIGSGKSTLLMAIEFALFGLGSEKSGALLRAGESKGTVNLCFETDGQEYEIQRALVKKGKSVQQTEGFIKSGEGLLHLSPTELKEKVLEILNFNEPADPKAQSNIYRYAVFTPQEEMKAILVMNHDARLQTLRKAFRIEDYKIARDNAESTSSSIERQADIFEASASDLDETKQTLEMKLQELSGNEQELKTLTTQEKNADEKLKELKTRQESLKGERDNLSQVKGELPEIQRQIQDKNGDKTNFEGIAQRALKKASDLKLKRDELLKVEKPTEKTIEQLNQELTDLRTQQRDLIKSQSTADAKIQDYAHIEEKGVCPTCDREADAAEFKSKIESKREEKDIIAQDLTRCDAQLDDNQRLLDRLREYNDAQKRITEYDVQILEQNQLNEENTRKAKTLEEEIKKLNERLEETKKGLERLTQLSEQLRQLDTEVSQAEAAFRNASIQVSAAKTKIEEGKKRAEELKNDVKAKEESIRKSKFLREYVIWLSDFFVPTIENIERHVLITIHEEFNELFQHWFSLLVEDPTKDARIDEDFTPIIEQDGYEQDVQYLSGGEKTSVALAYRLALNMLVRKVSTSMKSSLLILDEPTDGFSKEQLFKVRDILKELDCPQIVIVSHEKELESFADQVYKITKVNGASCVGV
jgi:exonuclease SbcC